MTTINLLPMATQDLLWQVTRNDAAKTDAERAELLEGPRLRQGLHRPHGRHLLVGEGRMAPSARAGLRPDRARPGRRRAALRAGDLRGPQGLPPRGRLDLELPPRAERGAHAEVGPPARAARAARPSTSSTRSSSSSPSTPPGCREQDETSLYLRPFMFAKEAFLGVRPAAKVNYYLIASPAGAYFPGGVKPLSIWLSTSYTRAGHGGMGQAKTGGNYASSLVAQAEAYEHGCQQVLFLDAQEGKYLEELGGMNVVLVTKDKRLITPESDSILEGITLESILQLAKDRGYTVEQRPVTIDEWRDGVTSGDIVEAFACGTAAVVTPIGELKSADGTITMPDAADSVALSLRDGAHRHPVRPRRGPPRLDDAARRASANSATASATAARRARGCTSWSPSNQRTSMRRREPVAGDLVRAAERIARALADERGRAERQQVRGAQGCPASRAGGTGSPGTPARSPFRRRAARRRPGSRRGRRTTCRRSPPASRRSRTISATASRYSPIASSAFGGGRRTPCAPAGHVGELEARGPDAAVAEQAADRRSSSSSPSGRPRCAPARRWRPATRARPTAGPWIEASDAGAGHRRPIGSNGAYRPVQRRRRRPPFRHRRRRRAGRARRGPDLPGLRHHRRAGASSPTRSCSRR